MPDYYGDFVKLGPDHYGCNSCGTEIWAGGFGEPRWCTSCQGFIWDEGADKVRRLLAQAHKEGEVVKMDND